MLTGNNDYEYGLNEAASELRTGGGEHASASGEGAEGPLGLSKVHIGPYDNKYGSISYFSGSHLITMKTPWTRSASHKQAHKRGKIVGFSKGSRRRMMTMMARIDKSELPIFVTLTYPDEYPSAKKYKRDIKAFIQRLKRRWPVAGGVWKLEFEIRKTGKNKGNLAPHYHILLYGVPYKEALSEISKMWFEVVGSDDEKHLNAGTRVERIKSHRGVMAYASKYIGKLISQDEVRESCGRIWGYFGLIPFADEVKIIINREMAVKLLRNLNRYIGIKNRHIRTYFVGDSSRWLECHEGISGDIVPF